MGEPKVIGKNGLALIHLQNLSEFSGGSPFPVVDTTRTSAPQSLSSGFILPDNVKQGGKAEYKKQRKQPTSDNSAKPYCSEIKQRTMDNQWASNGKNQHWGIFTCLSSVSSWALVGGVSCLQPF